jgi:hypothetical protein
MNELETRKQLLIAEAEVYRQTLKLECQNLRIYALKTKRKMTSFRSGNPVLAFGIPMLTSLLARKRKARRWSALAFLGWQLYSKLGGLLAASRVAAQRPCDDSTEAEEYLARRM